MAFNCICGIPPFNYQSFESYALGFDSRGGEISIETCKICKESWIIYLIEEPHYSNSGRWWRAKLTVSAISIHSAIFYIESQESCFIGGSFVKSTGKKIVAPIKIA